MISLLASGSNIGGAGWEFGFFMMFGIYVCICVVLMVMILLEIVGEWLDKLAAWVVRRWKEQSG